MYDMKKLGYLAIGIISGVLLTISFSAAAEELQNLVGKTVDSQVSVNIDGKDLETSAIIVDGSSYAPVRAIGEAAGLNVDFKNNKVILTKKESTDKMQQYQEKIRKREELQKKVDDLVSERATLYDQFHDKYEAVAPGLRKMSNEEYNRLKTRYDETSKELDELYKQIQETY